MSSDQSDNPHDPVVALPPVAASGCRAVIVMPCYNEEQRLDQAALLRFVAEHPDDRLLLVDDGSRDGTLAVLHAVAERGAGRVEVLALARNGGKAEAVRAGMLRAATLRPRYFGYWDADLATPLDAVDDFLTLIEAADDVDLVLGSRVKLLGRSIERNPVRHLLGRVFATFASWTLRLPVYDTQCGAKLLRCREPVVALFREPFAVTWVFDVELIARYLRSEAGGQIHELPLQAWRDVPGSKVRPHHFVLAIRELAVVAHQHRRYRRLPRR